MGAIFNIKPAVNTVLFILFTTYAHNSYSQAPSAVSPGAPPAGSVKARAVIPAELKPVAAAYDRAIKYHRSGKIDKAIAAYQEFIKLGTEAKLPRTSLLPGYQNLGSLFEITGNFKAASEALMQVVEISPKDSSALSHLAAILAGMGNYTRAKSYAEKALALNPTPKIAAPAHFALGSAAGASKDLITAEREFRITIELSPENPQAQFNYALILNRQKKLKPALEIINKAIRLAPNFIEARLFKAYLFQELKNIPAALIVYEEVLKSTPQNPSALLNKALMLQKIGRSQEALTSYLKVIALYPKTLSAQMNTAQLYYGLQNFPAAKTHYESALKIDPKSPDALTGLALAELQEGLHYGPGAQGNETLKSSEKHLKQVLTEAPKNQQATLGLAMLYERSNRYDEALSIYKRNMEADPENLDNYYRVANVYTMQRKLTEILTLWKGYRSRHPESPVSYEQSARVYYTQGDHPGAIEQWKLLLVMRPKDADALISIAKEYVILKQFKEAANSFQAVLAMDKEGADLPSMPSKQAASTTMHTLRLESMRGLAEIAQKNNDSNEAVSWYARVLAEDREQGLKLNQPPSADSFKNLANAYLLAKKTELAEKEYIAWTTASPDSVEAFSELALFQDRQNKPDAAAEAYRRAVSISKDPSIILPKIPELFVRRHNLKQGLTEFESIRKLYPKDNSFLVAMAQAYEQNGQDEKAIAIYDEYVAAAPNSDWVLDRKATCLRRLKRYSEAKSLYEKEIDRNSENYQMYSDVAVLFTEQGKPEEFLPWVIARFEKKPDSITLMKALLDTYARRKKEQDGYIFIHNYLDKHPENRAAVESFASVLIQKGKTPEAVEVYRKMALKYPSDIRVQRILAQQLQASSKTEEAENVYEKLLIHNEISEVEKVPIRRELAEWLKESGNSAKAIEQYRAILITEPGDVSISLKLIQLYSDSSHYSEALDVLIPISKKSEYPPVLRAQFFVKTAGIYEKMNRKPDAIKSYKEAIKVDAGNSDAISALKRLGEG